MPNESALPPGANLAGGAPVRLILTQPGPQAFSLPNGGDRPETVIRVPPPDCRLSDPKVAILCHLDGRPLFTGHAAH